MIEAHGLVKRYGATLAVDRLSFDVRAGTVTGFLGPNGAGRRPVEVAHRFSGTPPDATNGTGPTAVAGV